MAYPTLAARNIPATIYSYPTAVDTVVHCTHQNLQEMYADAWDIGSHSYTHPHLDELSLVDCKAQFINNTAALDGWGFTRSSKHVAYPNGRYAGFTLQAMAETGMLTGRTCEGGAFTTKTIHDGSLLYLLSICYVLNTTTLDQAKGWADFAKAQGRTIIFLFHTITEGAAVNTYDWSNANLAALADYLVSIGLATKTISQWYASYVTKFP